nr:MAG TPA: hypothetical protein [Caudoviricetes sp.]
MPFSFLYLIFYIIAYLRLLIEFLSSYFSCKVFGVTSYKLQKLGLSYSL